MLIGIFSVFMIWRGKKVIGIVVWPWWGEQGSQYDSVICVTNIRNFRFFFFQPINSMIVWLCICLRMIFPSSRWLTASRTHENIQWSALIEFQASSNFLRYFFLSATLSSTINNTPTFVPHPFNVLIKSIDRLFDSSFFFFFLFFYWTTILNNILFILIFRIFLDFLDFFLLFCTIQYKNDWHHNDGSRMDC